MALLIEIEGIPVADVYCFDHWSKSLDFYAHSFIPEITLDEFKKKKPDKTIWVFTYQAGFDKLWEAGITWENIYSKEHYVVTQLRPKFLNPNT